MLAINPIISLRGFNPLLRRFLDGMVYISNEIALNTPEFYINDFITDLKKGFSCNNIDSFLKKVISSVADKNAKQYIKYVNMTINNVIYHGNVVVFSENLINDASSHFKLLNKIKDYKLRKLMVDAHKCILKQEANNLNVTYTIISNTPFKVLFTITSPLEYKVLNNSLEFIFEREEREGQTSINSISINRVKNNVYCEVLYNFQVNNQVIYAKGLNINFDYPINLQSQ